MERFIKAAAGAAFFFIYFCRKAADFCRKYIKKYFTGKITVKIIDFTLSFELNFACYFHGFKNFYPGKH